MYLYLYVQRFIIYNWQLLHRNVCKSIKLNRLCNFELGFFLNNTMNCKQLMQLFIYINSILFKY